MNQFDLDTIIDQSLRTKPTFRLPDGFAQKVVKAVSHRRQLKSDLKEYLILTAVILSLVSVAIGLYYYVDKESVLRAIDFASGNLIQVILVVLLLNFIFFADRVLLPLLFTRWKMNG
jgi:hypothetical protein